MITKTTRADDFIRSALFVLAETNSQTVQRTVAQLEYDLHYFVANPDTLSEGDKRAMRAVAIKANEATEKCGEQARIALNEDRIEEAVQMTVRHCCYEDLVKLISLIP